MTCRQDHRVRGCWEILRWFRCRPGIPRCVTVTSGLQRLDQLVDLGPKRLVLVVASDWPHLGLWMKMKTENLGEPENA